MALFGLFQCFNGNFAASTRLLFAYARRGTVAPRFATIHAKFSTPSVAVIGITVGTLLGLLLGDSILVPITEVGSMASALGWLAACLSFWFVEPRLRMRIVTSPRHLRLPAPPAHEAGPRLPRPLHALRMDRPSRLASPRRRPPPPTQISLAASRQLSLPICCLASDRTRPFQAFSQCHVYFRRSLTRAHP